MENLIEERLLEILEKILRVTILASIKLGESTDIDANLHSFVLEGAAREALASLGMDADEIIQKVHMQLNDLTDGWSLTRQSVKKIISPVFGIKQLFSVT